MELRSLFRRAWPRLRRRFSRRERDAVVFPLFLWWFATFFFLGRWGKYSDDYAFGLRDPVSGAIDGSATPFPFRFFYRPLHFLFTNYLQTFFWNDQWVLHLLNAAVHGLVAWNVGLLLRRLGVAGPAASVGALLFLVAPIHYDVVFWPAALSTGTAALLWLVLARRFLRYVSDGRGHAALPVLMILSFAIPCFNEQASTGVLALPLLFFVARSASSQAPASMRRAVLAAGLCALAVALYAGLLLATAPPWARGSAQSLIGPSELWPRLQQWAFEVSELMTRLGKDLARGSFQLGWQALAGPLRALVFAGLAVAASRWLRWWLTSSLEGGRTTAGWRDLVGARRAWAVLFAALLWLAAWLPNFLVEGQRFPSRVFYFPDLGLALLLGIGLDVLSAAAARWRTATVLRTVVGVTAVALALLGAVSMVGFQAAFRERSIADQRQARQLRSLVPDPPAGTVFLPLADHFRAARTGNNVIDRLSGWLSQSWTVTPMVKHTYRRKDLFATHLNLWFPLPLSGFDSEGLRYALRFEGWEIDPQGGSWVRWDQTVPFVVGERGEIELVSRLVVEMPDQEDLDLRFPIVEEAARAHQSPTRSLILAAAGGVSGIHELVPIIAPESFHVR